MLMMDGSGSQGWLSGVNIGSGLGLPLVVDLAECFTRGHRGRGIGSRVDEGACSAWFLEGDTCRGCARPTMGLLLDASAA